jgi:hypothetical protein
MATNFVLEESLQFRTLKERLFAGMGRVFVSFWGDMLTKQIVSIPQTDNTLSTQRREYITKASNLFASVAFITPDGVVMQQPTLELLQKIENIAVLPKIGLNSKVVDFLCLTSAPIANILPVIEDESMPEKFRCNKHQIGTSLGNIYRHAQDFTSSGRFRSGTQACGFLQNVMLSYNDRS